MIGIISYRTGNATSVKRALDHLGLSSRLVTAPTEAGDVDRFVLPGVGAAGVTMASLRERGWVEYLHERVLQDRTPFLGVCVGVQVLFEHSEEGDTTCLGWLAGRVTAFDPSTVRVPQMGWNEVQFQGGHSWVADRKPDHYYFVNSFHIANASPEVVAGTTEYGGQFVSAVASGTVLGTQFHIEKSGQAGLDLLGAFARLPAGVKAC